MQLVTDLILVKRLTTQTISFVAKQALKAIGRRWRTCSPPAACGAPSPAVSATTVLPATTLLTPEMTTA
jgi:hypothetical protein